MLNRDMRKVLKALIKNAGDDDMSIGTDELIKCFNNKYSINTINGILRELKAQEYIDAGGDCNKYIDTYVEYKGKCYKQFDREFIIKNILVPLTIGAIGSVIAELIAHLL